MAARMDAIRSALIYRRVSAASKKSKKKLSGISVNCGALISSAATSASTRVSMTDVDAMERAEQQARPAMMRDVWFVSPASYAEAHFAVMADEIARRCILAGCPEGGTVLDPFGGAGTTGLVADRIGRNATLIELNPDYADMAERRIKQDAGMFANVSC